MARPISVRRVLGLNEEEIARLIEESEREGFRHLRRLTEEYELGLNRFDGPGEALFGAYDGERMIGIGGLNRDPYTSRTQVGRLRRLYVSRPYPNGNPGILCLLQWDGSGKSWAKSFRQGRSPELILSFNYKKGGCRASLIASSVYDMMLYGVAKHHQHLRIIILI